MKTSGCAFKYAVRAVVPHFIPPIIRKFGFTFYAVQLKARAWSANGNSRATDCSAQATDDGAVGVGRLSGAVDHTGPISWGASTGRTCYGSRAGHFLGRVGGPPRPSVLWIQRRIRTDHRLYRRNRSVRRMVPGRLRSFMALRPVMVTPAPDISAASEHDCIKPLRVRSPEIHLPLSGRLF